MHMQFSHLRNNIDSWRMLKDTPRSGVGRVQALFWRTEVEIAVLHLSRAAQLFKIKGNHNMFDSLALYTSLFEQKTQEIANPTTHENKG